MHIFVAHRILSFDFLTDILSRRSEKFRWNCFLMRICIHRVCWFRKKKCWFVKPPLQLERYLFSATISRHFYFKYKYTYGSFVFEQLLMWVKTFCHHVEQGGPAEMNDIFFFSRKKSTYSLPACSEFWFLVFLSLQTLNIKRLRYFLKLFSVVMPH